MTDRKEGFFRSKHGCFKPFERRKIFSKEKEKPEKRKRKSDNLPVGDKMQGCSGILISRKVTHAPLHRNTCPGLAFSRSADRLNWIFFFALKG
jgi:hypothetical protein